MMEQEHLEVSIQKQLKGFKLDMQFSANNGCTGILGASGCGKSMTLKSIAGIVQPDTGKIILDKEGQKKREKKVFFDSSCRCSMKPQQRQVGYLFQNYALFPNMTVAENITIGLKTRRIPMEQQRIISHKMISMFHLEGLEKQYPMKLSGGQQQRVALARNLAFNPQILLLDEPFSAMDTYLREGLRLELQKVLKEYQGITILVTHDRDEAYQLCDNLLLLDQGKVLQKGTTKEVFEHPQTPKAARLTGCKNISKIKKLDDYRVQALDWGNIELVTAQKVTNNIEAIGIRAHDFIPVDSQNISNAIPVGKVSISEMPFEWYITLENGIWWKREKAIHSHQFQNMIPAYLSVDPTAILLLEEDK